MQPKKKPWNPKLVVLIALGFLLFCISLQGSYSITTATQSETYLYTFDINFSYSHRINHQYGIQNVSLVHLDSATILGYISWNITFDEGNTWQYFSFIKTYYVNRTYNYAGFLAYTGWWIPPTVKIGEQIPIDGDAPVTASFPRSGPFIVTELATLKLANQTFMCWLLTYEMLNEHQEQFYYERYTGILLAAYSRRYQSGELNQTLRLELINDSPLLPRVDPLNEFWLSYGSMSISFLGAILPTAAAYYFLRRLRHRRVNRLCTASTKQKA
jgi:hypothetical protein